MKILHITNHEGTTKNIQSVFDQLNMNHSLNMIISYMELCFF